MTTCGWLTTALSIQVVTFLLQHSTGDNQHQNVSLHARLQFIFY